MSPFLEMRYHFYALVDPFTRQIRYIGRTRRGYDRIDEHVRNDQGTPEKRAWIAGLRARGAAPEVLGLEFGSYSSITSSRREGEIIAHFFRKGHPLLNINGRPRVTRRHA